MDRKKKKTATDGRRILIAGGRLQGTELVYLAKKAGYTVTLLDKQKNVPAAGLADRCIEGDIFDEALMQEALVDVVCVIPAIEDAKALDRLEESCQKSGILFLFDREAYQISASKGRTNRLLEELGIRIPEKFPVCGYPVICKPDAASGSRDVRKIETKEEWDEWRRNNFGRCVVQQYLSGPSYSLEVLGDGKQAIFPMITEVVTDAAYDCKRIVAPAGLTGALEKEFLHIAKRINHRLHICGIFDIEVILHNGQLYVLEIDARFPSQTPISVYHASGMNFVEMLLALAEGEELSEKTAFKRDAFGKACIYQQIFVKNDTIKVCGEHIMSDAGPLRLLPGFCEAEEMLTDYRPGADQWRAIVILTGRDQEEVDRKWKVCLDAIAVLQGCMGGMRYIEG